MGAGASLEAAAVMPQVREEYQKLVKGEITEAQACKELKKKIDATPTNTPQKAAPLQIEQPAPEAVPAEVMSPVSSMKKQSRSHSWLRHVHQASAEGDKWETTKQPVCHLCKMVFPNQLKLDRHIQYSVVHKKNMEAQAAVEKEADTTTAPPPPVPTPSILDLEGMAAQLMYSGSKLFWRSRETYDVHIYLHPSFNCLEIVASDCDVELRRLYLNYEKIAAKGQVEPIGATSSDANESENSSRPSTPMPDEACEAEHLRRRLTHYIMARLQLKTYADMKGLCLRALGDDQSADGMTFLEPPPGLPHTSVRKRRRTSITDFENLLDNFQQNAKALENSTSKADSLVNASVDTVQKLTKGRRRHQHQTMSTLPDAKKRWNEASVKGTLVLDVDKTKQLLQDMADAVQQAENVIRSPDVTDTGS